MSKSLKVNEGRLKVEVDGDALDPTWTLLNWTCPAIVLLASLLTGPHEPQAAPAVEPPGAEASAGAAARCFPAFEAPSAQSADFCPMLFGDPS